MGAIKKIGAAISGGTALLVMLAVIIAAAILGIGLARIASNLGSLFVWCGNFLLAVAGGRVAGAAAFVAVGILIGSIMNLAKFLWAEAVGAGRLRRVIPASRRRFSRSAAAVSMVVIDDVRPYAFTFGLASPRVAVTAGLLGILTVSELSAVLSHERHHARWRHPLRSFLWEAACRFFFFLPILRDVSEHAAVRREIAADGAAGATTGAKRALAKAMLKTVSDADWLRFRGVAAFGAIGARAEALTNGGRRIFFEIRRARLVATFFVAVGMIVIHGWTMSPAAARILPESAALKCEAEQKTGATPMSFSRSIRIKTPVTMSRGLVQIPTFHK